MDALVSAPSELAAAKQGSASNGDLALVPRCACGCSESGSSPSTPNSRLGPALLRAMSFPATCEVLVRWVAIDPMRGTVSQDPPEQIPIPA